MNLCVNAAQAMQGRGKIRVTFTVVDSVPPGVMLDFTGGARGPFARFSVEDEGPGLPDGDARRLFDPYVTVGGEGTGLGLDVVKRFVASARGAVGVSTRPGRGTRFDVFLPICAPSPPKGTSTERKDVIVLVDDDEAVRQITAEILEEAGWRVRVFGSGESAIRFFGQREWTRVGLLITDVYLEGPTGLEVVRAARSRDPGLPVLVITGDPFSPLCRRLVDTVPNVVLLRKPWRRGQLLDLVGQLLGRRGPTEPAPATVKADHGGSSKTGEGNSRENGTCC